MSGDDSNSSKNQGPGINRRDLARMLAGGAGAFGFLAKGQKPRGHGPVRPAAAFPPVTVALGQSAVIQWTDTLISPAGMVTGACYYNGLVAISAQNGPFGSVICSDIHDGQMTTQGIAPLAGSFQTPVGCQGNIIASVNNGSQIQYVIIGNPNQGLITPPPPQSSLLPIYGGGALAYVDQSGNLTAIQISGINQYTVLWSGPVLTGAVGEITLMQATNSQLAILNSQGSVTVVNIAGANTTTPPAVLTTITMNLGFPIEPIGGSADGNNIYVVAINTTNSVYQLSAISLSDYSSPWTTTLSSQPSAPLSVNGTLYFVDAGGAFRSMDSGSGTPGWFTSVPGCDNTAPFYQEDGNIYICSPSGTLYGIPLAAQGSGIVSVNMGSQSILLGVENSICFVLNQAGAAVSGVDVAGELHGFSCDSTLMADNYIAGTSPAPAIQPASPAYTSIIQLVDPQNNPRSYKNVRIQASDTTTITFEGQTYNLNPNDSVWITTDAGGNLTIVTPATDVQSPALYLWGDFMDRTESLVIYPDHATINSLASKQGMDYQMATGFDGSSVLAPTSSGGPDPNQVAMTIANTLGGGSIVPTPTSRCSYPASSTNLAYQSVMGSTTRVFSAGSSQTAYTNIGTDGSVSFNTGTPPPSPAASAASFLSFDDFKNDIVKGAKKIAQLAVAVGSSVVHTITAATGEIYQFTVSSIEQAITVVSGFIRSVIADISKAVEWLSQIFSWKDIVATQQAIIGFVTNTQQQVRSYINTDIATIKATLDSFFSGLITTVQGQIASITSQIGSQTMQSTQQNGNDPKSGYNANGASGWAPSSNMTSKVTTNQKQATNVQLGTATPLSMAQVTQKAQNYMTAIPAALGPSLQDLQTAFDTFLGTFQGLVSDPRQFITHAFGDFLVVLGDVAAVILKAINIVIDTVLGDIADLLDTLVSILGGTVDIPVVSQIFQLIFGKPVTFLDLAALLIAIPTSIVTNVVHSASTSGNAAKPKAAAAAASMPSAKNWSSFFCNLIGAIVDAENDQTNADAISPVNLIDLALSCITFGTSVPSTFNNNDPAICYYAFEAVPLIISLINIILAASSALEGPTGPEVAAGFNQATYGLTGIYGGFHLIVGIVNAFNNPAEFSDPDHLTLCENIFADLGLYAKVLAYDYRPALVVTDILFPETSGGLGLAAALA
jgi:hypothetical protein